VNARRGEVAKVQGKGQKVMNNQRLLSTNGWLARGCFLSCLSLAACSAPEQGSAENRSPENPEYLAYGVSIPEDMVPALPPEPYDSLRHGPTFNPVPELDLVAHPGKLSLPDAPAGDGDRGFFINGTAGIGIYARNDVQDNVVIPAANAGTTIYAPTHQSPGGSCIETVRASWRPVGASGTSHGHGFWDWCRASPGWGSFEAIDATWKSKYARSDGSENMYYTNVYKSSGNCWVGLLWNYNTGVWDQKLSSCGTTKTGFGTTGWTMWESWSLTSCPAFPRIKSTTIQTYVGGSWQALTPARTTTLGPSGCFSSGAYTFAVLTANSAWEGRTP